MCDHPSASRHTMLWNSGLELFLGFASGDLERKAEDTIVDERQWHSTVTWEKREFG